MKIVQLRAENVKRLQAVEITPDGNLVVVSGKNGAGKSSVLDSIWYALGGKEALKGVRKPIRDGEKRAEVSLDLGDLRVTRSWTADDKTYLRVEAQDGKKFSSPQQVLDNIIGRFSFDPLAFVRQAEKEQVATLLDMLNLPVDIPAMDQRRAEVYDHRTEVGRVVVKLEGQLAGMPEPPDDLPASESSGTEVMEAYRAALEVEHANDQVMQRWAEVEGLIDDTRAEIETIKQQLLDKGAELAALIEEQESLLVRVSNLTDPNPSQYKERLAELELVNAQVREARQREAVAAELRVNQAAYHALTHEIDEVDAEKKRVLEAAAMPIDGLGFDDGGVTYQGLPLKQAATSEQLRVGLAIAMALNPTLRVVRISDGSLLDEGGMQLVSEMAAAGDMQVWLERVDSSGGVGVVIEDGHVVAQA